MPQIKEMAKKEGVRKVDLEKNKEEDGEKKPANKANIILNALKGWGTQANEVFDVDPSL